MPVSKDFSTSMKRLTAMNLAEQSPKENPPDDEQHRHHEWQGEFPDVTQKSRGVNVLLVRDRFDHEIRAVSNVSVGAKKNRPGANRDDEFAQAGVAEQEAQPDF